MKKFSLLLLIFGFIVCLLINFNMSKNNCDYDCYCLNYDYGFVKEYKKDNHIIYKNNDVIVGECFIYENVNINELQEELGCNILKKYSVGSKTIIEGFSPLIYYSIPNSNSNIQISIEDNKVIVGMPVIFGSY